MPMNKGEIQTATYVLYKHLNRILTLISSSINVGENTLGASFKESYPSFDSTILPAYGDFLRTVYCTSPSLF